MLVNICRYWKDIFESNVVGSSMEFAWRIQILIQTFGIFVSGPQDTHQAANISEHQLARPGNWIQISETDKMEITNHIALFVTNSTNN